MSGAAANTLEESAARAAAMRSGAANSENALISELRGAPPTGRPPVPSGSTPRPTPPQPANIPNPLDYIPIRRTVEGVPLTVRPSAGAPDLLHTVDAPPGFTIWGRGNKVQGELAEAVTGGRGTLPWNHEVDRLENRVVTSVKSIDLNRTTIREGNKLSNLVNRYIDDIADFEFSTREPLIRRGADFDSAALEIVVPRGTLSNAPGGREFMQIMVQRARDRGVALRFFEVP
ncbi:MAG: hypothetical protein K1X75_12545 [Leptospirales bacterium]|nr:hypothetical protein [Leptospirales bacterium]